MGAWRAVRRRITFANIVSLAGLFLVLSSGVAYAAATVTSADIVNGTIAQADVKANALGSSVIKDGSLQSVDVLDGTLTGADVQDGSLSGADVANGTLASADLLDGTVASADVADNSLTAADLAADSVGSSELANNSVGTNEISAGAVGNSDLAFNSVTGAEIADFSLNNEDIAVLYAEVNSNGSLASTCCSGTSSTRTDVGEYEVTFNFVNFDSCTAIATIGPPDTGGSQDGSIIVRDTPADSSTWTVWTFDRLGNFADRPFHLVPVC